jgi:DNA-binding XRE family transcriptional regulator
MSLKRSGFVNRRKALKLTQKQVGDAIGVTSRTIQSWELGEHPPKLTLLKAWQLCQVLQCTLEELAKDFHPEAFTDSDKAQIS